MITTNFNLRLLPAVIATASMLIVAGCSDRARERAAAQIERIADDLDSKTTATGVYIRVRDDDLKESHPWGTRIRASYSQGGFAETIDVRSAGPDREFHTSDDLVAQRLSANLKGVGEGVKKNVEETASSAAKGIVKGTVQGVKESIRDSLPRKKKKTDDAEEAPPEKE